MPDGSSWQRLATILRREVGAGRPGDRLPSSRELVARHQVSPITVRRAIAALEREGLVEARTGAGTFIARRTRPVQAGSTDWQLVAMANEPPRLESLTELVGEIPPGAIPLGTGFLGEDLQAAPEVTAAMRKAASRPQAWSRTTVAGLPPLRSWFASEIGGEIAAGLTADDVLICPGTQAALAVIFRSVCPAGVPVLMESPAFVGAIVAARAAGLPIIPVPTDEHGLRTDLLARPLISSGARAIYLQPAHANPHGVTLAAERRQELLALARRYGVFIIEDDWARYLSFATAGNAPPPPLVAEDPDGHVLHLRSLSKPAVPGLRIGAIIARGPAAQRLRRARVVDDFFVTTLLQETALQLVTGTSWPRRLRRLHTELHRRRDHLVELVTELLGPGCLPHKPTGGLHLWLRLPVGRTDAEVAEAAARRNVIVNPGRHWFPAEPTGDYLRISFAGTTVDALTEGMRVLADACRAPTGRDIVRP